MTAVNDSLVDNFTVIVPSIHSGFPYFCSNLVKSRSIRKKYTIIVLRLYRDIFGIFFLNSTSGFG